MARPTNSNKIQILQATGAGVAPDFTLEAGELAINRTDNYLFYENAAGSGNTTVYLPTADPTNASSLTSGVIPPARVTSFTAHNIDNGSSAITTTGVGTFASLDISGNVDIDGVLETDNLTVGGVQGSDGQVLTSTGSGVAWEDAGGGSGTVTSVATSGGLSGGTITGSGTITTTGVLQDLNTLGAPASDGQFIVATSSGVFAYESTSTARTSLGLGTAATRADAYFATGAEGDLATNAMPKAGGTFTGDITLANNEDLLFATNGGSTIGSTSSGLGSMYIYDMGTIYWGDDQDISLSYNSSHMIEWRTGSGASGTNLDFWYSPDNQEDNIDVWRERFADGGVYSLANYASGAFVTHMSITPNSTVANSTTAIAGHATIGHDLTVSGNLTVTGNNDYSDLVAGDIPTLNQNTTGSAATLTTARAINGTNFDGSAAITITAAGSTLSDTVTVAKGGTGATSLNNLITMGTHTTGNYVGTITGGDGITSSAATSGENTTHSLSATNVLYSSAGLGSPDGLADISTGSADGDKMLIYDVSGSPTWKFITRTNLESAISSGGGGSGTINSGSTAEVGVYSGSTTLDGYSGLTFAYGTGDLTVSNIVSAAAGEVELNPDGLYLGINNFITFEAQTANAYEGLLKWPSVTSSDKTINLPDASGTVCVLGGTGLTLSSGGSMAVDAAQTQITSVGTIGTGVWNGTKIASGYIADDAIDSQHLANDLINSGNFIANDVINSEHYVAGSIDLEHMNSQSVDEDNLYISNSGSNGQFLSKQSGNSGGLTWATPPVDLTTLITNDGANRVLTTDADGTLTAEGQMTVDSDAVQLGVSTGCTLTYGQSTHRIMQARGYEAQGGGGNTSTVIPSNSHYVTIQATADEIGSVTHTAYLPDPEGGDAPIDGQVIKIVFVAIGSERFGGINTTGTCTLARTSSVGGRINKDASYSVNVCSATGPSTFQSAMCEVIYNDANATWILFGGKTMGVSNSGWEAV